MNLPEAVKERREERQRLKSVKVKEGEEGEEEEEEEERGGGSSSSGAVVGKGDGGVDELDVEDS